MNQNQSPIFIHSLFRAGSTYLFNVFRRSNAGYWCYQEPLSEKLIYHATKPGGFVVGVEGAHKTLRHPELTKPHNYEYHVVSDVVINLFKKEFSYEQYFENSAAELEHLNTYLHSLIDGAKGRAVLQCCRTTGRVAALQEEFGGTHIFLWRNPWDQWWSYKQDPYFDSRNLFILGAKKLPAFLELIRKELKIISFSDSTPTQQKEAYFNNKRLSSSASYIIFYALWCHAMLEAKPKCHFTINIDKLTLSEEYRTNIVEDLKLNDISGIDFSDCSVALSSYSENDGKFFDACEKFVHKFLANEDYDINIINQLKTLGDERIASLVNINSPENFAIRDAARAREYARTLETKLSEMQNQLFITRAKLHQNTRHS